MAKNYIDYTVDDLITKVKNRVGAVSSGKLQTDDTTLIDLLDTELNSTIVTEINNFNTGFFIDSEDITLVSGQQVYPIPSDAMFMGLRNLTYIDPNGVETTPVSIFTENQAASMIIDNGAVVRGNNFYLYPIPGSDAQQLRIKYMKRLNKLTSSSNCAEIASINSGTNSFVVTYTQVQTWGAGDTLDVLQPIPPFGIETGLTINSVSWPTIYVDDVSELEVGDWVALSGMSPIPQIPYEMFTILIQCGVVKTLAAMGNTEKWQIQNEILGDMIQLNRTSMQNRVSGATPSIVTGGTVADFAGNPQWPFLY